MKKVPAKTAFVICICSFFMLMSCASGRTARDNAKSAYENNNYKAALSYLQKENKKQDLIDLNLDEAMLLFLDGKYKESSEKFNHTNMQMSQLSGKMTVGQMVAAGLTSEASIKYAGPAYEYSLLDTMNAFNYMKLDDYDSARAMMRRSFNNNKQAFNELKAKVRELNHQSEMSLHSQSTQSAFNDMADEGLQYDFHSLVNSGKKEGEEEYQLSPFIFFLGAALFANDYETSTAKDWMSNISPFISKGLTDSVINIPQKKGSINVVSLTDTISRREEAEFFFNTITDLFGIRVNFKLTWPYVPKSYNVVDDVVIRILKEDNGSYGEIIPKVHAELIEDFDDAVRRDVASKAEGSLSRSLVRNIVRKTAAYVAGIIAVETAAKMSEESDSDLAATIALISAITILQTSMDAIDATEHADVRQCVFFPSKASAAGIILDPGYYTVVVNYLDRNQRLLKSDVIENVRVEEGKPTVVPSEFINTGNFSLSLGGHPYYD